MKTLVFPGSPCDSDILRPTLVFCRRARTNYPDRTLISIVGEVHSTHRQRTRRSPLVKTRIFPGEVHAIATYYDLHLCFAVELEYSSYTVCTLSVNHTQPALHSSVGCDVEIRHCCWIMFTICMFVKGVCKSLGVMVYRIGKSGFQHQQWCSEAVQTKDTGLQHTRTSP